MLDTHFTYCISGPLNIIDTIKNHHDMISDYILLPGKNTRVYYMGKFVKKKGGLLHFENATVHE